MRNNKWPAPPESAIGVKEARGMEAAVLLQWATIFLDGVSANQIRTPSHEECVTPHSLLPLLQIEAGKIAGRAN